MFITKRAISSDEKLERKDAIVDASLEHLAKDNCYNIIIARIIRKVEIAKETIFSVFQNKRRIIFTVSIQGI
jgi:hypothetical protein